MDLLLELGNFFQETAFLFLSASVSSLFGLGRGFVYAFLGWEGAWWVGLTLLSRSLAKRDSASSLEVSGASLAVLGGMSSAEEGDGCFCLAFFIGRDLFFVWPIGRFGGMFVVSDG